MKASVILPVHNKSPFLRECVDSILTQSFTDFELIAVDDASTDDSLTILRTYKDPRLRIVALDRNLGPGSAAQAAIDQASGEYLVRVDADDVQLHDRFERQVAFLDAHPAVGACSGAVELFGTREGTWRKPLDHSACQVELLFGITLFQPASAYRATVLREHAIRYRPDWPWYGEDWMLQIELAKVTHLANLEATLVRYRQGPQNMGHGRDRAADLAFLITHAFGAWGLPEPTDHQIRLHGFALKHFEPAPSPQEITLFREWLRGLLVWNEGGGAFDHRVLEERCRMAWNELLYRVPEFGWGATCSYLRSGAHLTPARLWYLLRALFRQ